MTRRELREHLMKELFLREFYDEEEYARQCELYRESLEEVSEEDAAWLAEKADAVGKQIPALDDAINHISEGWKTKRMGKVDLTILRLAYFEMLSGGEVPVKVAINEAVELAKLYGGDESPSFVNAILGKLSRAMPGAEAPEE